MIQVGVPAVLLCTDAFEHLARMHASTAGLAGLPVIAVTHPLGGLDRATVGQRAIEAYERMAAGQW